MVHESTPIPDKYVSARTESQTLLGHSPQSRKPEKEKEIAMSGWSFYMALAAKILTDLAISSAMMLKEMG